jgi:HEAT repeat protein
MLSAMPFRKGQSGNPGGRAKVKLPDGRTLTDLAREHTEEAVQTLAEIMRDKTQPAAARVAAADKILNRGWGQAPQTIALTDVPPPPDLSSLTDEQLEALETLRSLAPLAAGVEGSC